MPERPVLCLLPGLLCDATVWAHQHRNLSDSADVQVADLWGLDSFEKMAAKVLDETSGSIAVAGHSMGGRVALEMWRLERPDATPYLAQIACPVLVLCGREDGWSPLARHEDMARRIPGARLCVIERCGHMATVERPGEVTDALKDWLASIRPIRTDSRALE